MKKNTLTFEKLFESKKEVLRESKDIDQIFDETITGLSTIMDTIHMDGSMAHILNDALELLVDMSDSLD